MEVQTISNVVKSAKFNQVIPLQISVSSLLPQKIGRHPTLLEQPQQQLEMG